MATDLKKTNMVFLSYKTEDGNLVVSIKKYLAKCLISCWHDSEDMRAGSVISTGINQGLANSKFFIAFISTQYLQSKWCMHELESAYQLSVQDDLIIVPVLLEAKDVLEKSQAFLEHKYLISSILFKNVIINERIDKTQKAINDTLASYIGIKFNPVILKTIQEIELQLINFEITTDDKLLASNFLSQWEINIEKDFMANENNHKPIHPGKAVAIDGKGPNWIFSYLSIFFKNLCPVYIFNIRSGEYICTYDPTIRHKENQLGKVLKK